MESGLVHDNPWNPASRWGGWEWRPPRRDEFYRTCSFCGSIHPGDLAAEPAGTGTCRMCGKQGWEAHFRAQRPVWARDVKVSDLTDEERTHLDSFAPEHTYDPGGWYVSWADQKYGWPHKFYVENLTPHDPDVLSVLSATTHLEGMTGEGWVLTENLTKKQKQIIKDDGWRGDNYVAFQFWHRPNCYAKFYTEHLKDPNISPEAIATIERVSGLHFEWLEDGRVRWSKP